jgi:hypothetical protein
MLCYLRSFAIALLLLTTPSILSAQFQEDDAGSAEDAVTPLGVVFGVKGGVVMTSPRGRFPSLIVGESKAGSGEIGSERSQTGYGSRFGVDLFVPFTPLVGLAAELGTMHYVARYSGDSVHPPTRMDAQTAELGLGFQLNLFSDPLAFRSTGLRALYFGGGIDLTLSTPANRIEAAAFPDSSDAAVLTVGSFDNSEPFRNLIALRGALGMRFAFDRHFELLGEASYAYALNSVFSSDVVRDNNFTVDNLALQIGVGYRF